MFEGYRIVGDKPFLSTDEEVDAAEQQIGVSFPVGYREYVTTFGEGVLGGSFIRIYPPHRILRDLPMWRERIDQFWLWDEGEEILTKDEALKSVVVGDTLNGDELVARPEQPDRIFVLPRYSYEVLLAGDGLENAIEWLCNSGKLAEAFSERELEPFSTR